VDYRALWLRSSEPSRYISVEIKRKKIQTLKLKQRTAHSLLLEVLSTNHFFLIKSNSHTKKIVNPHKLPRDTPAYK